MAVFEYYPPADYKVGDFDAFLKDAQSNGIDFGISGAQAKAVDMSVLGGQSQDFMTQYAAFKEKIAGFLKEIDRSFDPATWGVTNPDGTPVVAADFSWSDPKTWPAAFWAAFKPYAVAFGLVALAVLLIAAGFWKSLK